MKIALIGYGKLGKVIEQIAITRGHEITLKVTKANAESYQLSGCEIAIESTGPVSASKNITKCLDAGLPIVVGSTGWYDDFEMIKAETNSKNGALLYATNFSVGVHIFWEANKMLAQLMKIQPDYRVSLTEIHHTAKKDAPSGTAITTAEVILEQLQTQKHWKLVNEFENKDVTSLQVKAIREGDVNGTHIVTYESKVDKIELKHEAFNRSGFALGGLGASPVVSL